MDHNIKALKTDNSQTKSQSGFLSRKEMKAKHVLNHTLAVFVEKFLVAETT